MSLKLEREIKKLKKRIEILESRDDTLLKKVLYQAVEHYLEEHAEFSLSTDGQIKELINHG